MRADLDTTQPLVRLSRNTPLSLIWHLIQGHAKQERARLSGVSHVRKTPGEGRPKKLTIESAHVASHPTYRETSLVMMPTDRSFSLHHRASVQRQSGNACTVHVPARQVSNCPLKGLLLVYGLAILICAP